jgi:hypothetical protein
MARPTFKPTAAQRRTVSIAAGGGMAHADIAEALGISRPTLLKHFEVELSVMAKLRRMEVLQAMFVAAKKGNVAAQKAFVAMTPTSAVPPLPAEFEKPKAAAVGKKEQAQAEAQVAHVGTEWEELLKRPSAPLQ